MSQTDPEYEQWLERKRSDPRITEELLSEAMFDHESVLVLMCRGDRQVFEAARDLCASSISRERELGACLLGELGMRARSFQEEAVEILIGMLRPDECIAVLCAAAFALGHRKDSRAVPALVHFKAHPSEDVRYAVVHGLLTQEDPLAVDTLIELSRDEDAEVRNWATFGLGVQIDLDTLDIREALLARVDDEDEEVRGEALMGLARRKDARALTPLQRELSLDCVTWQAVEAAGELADPALVPALDELSTWWDVSPGTLQEAVCRCRGETVNA